MKVVVIKAIIIITMTVLAIVILAADYKVEKSLYNNGYCTCDNEWRLLNVSDHQYYFVCDKCGNTIHTTFSPSRLKED